MGHNAQKIARTKKRMRHSSAAAAAAATAAPATDTASSADARSSHVEASYRAINEDMKSYVNEVKAIFTHLRPFKSLEEAAHMLAIGESAHARVKAMVQVMSRASPNDPSLIMFAAMEKMLGSKLEKLRLIVEQRVIPTSDSADARADEGGEEGGRIVELE
ncbi:hypothetical protein H9P43_006827 [Blastocladiella emersonii ATCC 22665]|nr:hypothetical protein H9P43_006827 [Blastocladiella emersonii ATCC 22665]